MDREFYEKERERTKVKETKEDMIKFICMFNYDINKEDLEDKKLTYIRDLYKKTKAERKKRNEIAYQQYMDRYVPKTKRTYADYDYEEDREMQGPNF